MNDDYWAVIRLLRSYPPCNGEAQRPATCFLTLCYCFLSCSPAGLCRRSGDTFFPPAQLTKSHRRHYKERFMACTAFIASQAPGVRRVARDLRSCCSNFQTLSNSPRSWLQLKRPIRDTQHVQQPTSCITRHGPRKRHGSCLFFAHTHSLHLTT